MRTKTMASAFCFTILFASGSAFAHGFYFEGDANSNVGVIADAVAELGVLQEDETGAMQCQTLSAELLSCNLLQKHGRPLGPISDYSLGDYMDFEAGDADSNAAAVFTVLQKRVDEGDPLSTKKELSPSRTQISRDDGTTRLRCLQDTSAGEAMTECRIDTVKNTAQN